MEDTKVEANQDSEVKVVEKETYFNRETLETLTDPLDITYYKNLQFEEIVDNNLLGEFDKNGNYEINKEILLELIAARKFIKEAKDNKYILSSPTKEGFENFVFTLLIEDELDKQIATLRIIETDVKPNCEKELLKTIIAKYKDDRDIYFTIKVKKLFNIVDIEGDSQELNNEEFLKIILKRFQNFKSLKSRSGVFESNAKSYIDKVIEIMRNNPGKYSEYILRHYGIYLLEMQELKDKPKYYEKLKYKLDNLLNETRKKIKDPVIDPLIDAVRKDFLKQFENVKEEILNPKPVATKPKEKPPIKKQAEEAAKSGGGGKSGAKKVEAKKAEIKKAAANSYPTFKPQEKTTPKPEKPKEKVEEKKAEIQKQPMNLNTGLFKEINEVLDSSEKLVQSVAQANVKLGGQKINSALDKVQNLEM